jgi:hypothetical protein
MECGVGKNTPQNTVELTESGTRQTVSGGPFSIGLLTWVECFIFALLITEKAPGSYGGFQWLQSLTLRTAV